MQLFGLRAPENSAFKQHGPWAIWRFLSGSVLRWLLLSKTPLFISLFETKAHAWFSLFSNWNTPNLKPIVLKPTDSDPRPPLLFCPHSTGQLSGKHVKREFKVIVEQRCVGCPIDAYCPILRHLWESITSKTQSLPAFKWRSSQIGCIEAKIMGEAGARQSRPRVVYPKEASCQMSFQEFSGGVRSLGIRSAPPPPSVLQSFLGTRWQ